MVSGLVRTNKCPCGGAVAWEKQLVEIAGFDFGHHDVGICDACQARYLLDHSMDAIEKQVEIRGIL